MWAKLSLLGMLLFANMLIETAQAGEREELEKFLPRWKEAWNAENVDKLIQLFHPKSRLRRIFETDAGKKAEGEEQFKSMLEKYGKIEKWEVRKYIERKKVHVVRFTYSKGETVPGTGAIAKDKDDKWFLMYFNVDGQDEPELKE